ncbi:MAG: TIGR04086 family membrane protein [Clostridiales bacterium]|nr:TIGR04086 family membrane protein [Clostridiales bacterium]
MRKNDDKKNISHGFAVSVVIGAAVGYLVILALFAVFAAFIASGKLPESLMVYITAFTAFIGSLTGAVIAAKRLKGKAMTVSLSVGALMFLLTLIGAAFSDSAELLGKLTPALFIAFIFGGVVGGFFNARRKKRKYT